MGYDGKREERESTQPRSASAGEKRSLLPERMCINSDLLIKVLNDITSLDLHGPLVMIRPFKLLVYWEPEIRQRLSDLERKWKVHDDIVEKEKGLMTELKHKSASAEEKEDAKAQADDDGLYKKFLSNSVKGGSDDSNAGKDLESVIQEVELNHRSRVQLIGNREDNTEPKEDNQGCKPTQNQRAVPIEEEHRDERSQPSDPPDSASHCENPHASMNGLDEQGTERHNQDFDDLDDDITSADGKPALKRLRLLVKFMDVEVTGPLDGLKEAHRHQQVFFADLYHFFVPGEEVYKIQGSGTSEQVQAYRILQVTGGRRFNSNQKPGDEADTPEALPSNEIGSPLVISCIHIDTDGKDLGPVTTTFRINEYPGERDTASLPVWPLSFMKDPSDLRNDLEMRGQRFIELAQLSHKEYAGLTLKPVEDIDSQVIIDFDTAFQVNRSWAPNLEFRCTYFPGSFLTHICVYRIRA